MSVNKIDVRIQYPDQEVYTYPNIVASGAAASINAGEPTIKGTAGAVADMATSEPTTSYDFTGIAKNTSNDTSTAAGVVTLYFPFPGIVYSCAALSAAAVNTVALIQALQFKRVLFTKTTQTFTVATATADSTANGLCIVGGDGVSMVYFVVTNQVQFYANVTT